MEYGKKQAASLSAWEKIHKTAPETGISLSSIFAREEENLSRISKKTENFFRKVMGHAC